MFLTNLKHQATERLNSLQERLPSNGLPSGNPLEALKEKLSNNGLPSGNPLEALKERFSSNGLPSGNPLDALKGKLSSNGLHDKLKEKATGVLSSVKQQLGNVGKTQSPSLSSTSPTNVQENQQPTQDMNTQQQLTNTELIEEPKFFPEPEELPTQEVATKKMQEYTKSFAEYEKSLDYMKGLMDKKDFKTLEKFVGPMPTDETTNKSGIAQAGGAYMSRLGRMSRSVDSIVNTLKDPRNAGTVNQQQAKELQEKAESIKTVANQLDQKVRALDLESKYESGSDDNNAYKIPDEYYARYPPEVIENAKFIITIYAFVKNIFAKFMLAPRPVAISAIVSFLIVVANIGFAILFLVILVKKLLGSALIKNPINRQAQDFKISKIGSIRSPYTMMFLLFIITNGLALGLCIYGIISKFKNDTKYRHQTPGLVTAILFASLGQAAIGLVAALLLMVVVRNKLKGSANRISKFNRFVYSNLYKDVKFLKNLRTMPSNSFSLMDVVKRSLALVPAGASKEDTARAMFTLNMYMHFQKLGYKNPYTRDALLKTFNVVGLLRRRFYSPADYLHRRTTFIKDNGDVMRENLWNMAGDKFKKNVPFDYSTTLDNATIRASELTAEANNLANTFYPEDSLRIFLKYFIYMFAAQTLPLLVLLFVFKRKTLQQGFGVALGVVFSAPSTHASKPATTP